MASTERQSDTRTPSPPYGYSRECHYTRDKQVHIVAEYHAHKIRPSRIAYRVGIDIVGDAGQLRRFPGPRRFPPGMASIPRAA